MKIVQFTNQSMFEIINQLKLSLLDNNTVGFQVLNPDLCSQMYSGEVVKLNGLEYIYRGYKAWVNLSEILHCKIKTPKIISDNIVEIVFEKLEKNNSFHTIQNIDKSEKYGIESTFSRINKNEEPTFLSAYHKALDAVSISTKKSVLNLGINRADEFELIEKMVSKDDFREIKLVGVDHCATAISEARDRFPTKSFHICDINELDGLNLGKFELIISIGTLQSPSINYKPFLMNLVQNYLTGDGAVILGFPNSRWIDGELIYGAMAPNYNYSEMSLMYSDVVFAKKYLQQKKFRVTITGREYVILTATKIGVS